MAMSPGKRPLGELTGKELAAMARQATEYQTSTQEIRAEQIYREQRRLARWVAILIGGTLLFQVVSIGVHIGLGHR